MKSVNVIIKEELKKELKDLAKQVCIGAAEYSRDILTDAAYEAFERFYCDYTPVPWGLSTTYQFKFAVPQGVPKKYIRTYNVLKYGIEGYDNKSGKVIRGGVVIDPSKLKDNYDDTPQNVFESIYELGWHGPMGSGVPNMNPTPEELIYKSYNNLCNYGIGLVTNYLVGKTIHSQGYQYLHNRGITRSLAKIKGARKLK